MVTRPAGTEQGQVVLIVGFGEVQLLGDLGQVEVRAASSLRIRAGVSSPSARWSRTTDRGGVSASDGSSALSATG